MDDQRRSTRAPPIPRLPVRAESLFFGVSPARRDPALKGLSLKEVSSSPRVYEVANFLRPRELEHLDQLIGACRDSFQHSVQDAAGGRRVRDDDRTSLSLELLKGQDWAARAIEARAAELVGASPDVVEPLQLVSYADGASFGLHHDMGALENTEEMGIPGVIPDVIDVVPPRRIISVFVYLNDCAEGVGHTEFPFIEPPLSVRPRAGTALVWCNVDQFGAPNERLAHRGSPVPAPHRKFGLNIWVTDTSLAALAGRDAPRPARRTPRPTAAHAGCLRGASDESRECLGCGLGSSPESLLLCDYDRCQSAWHMACLDTPLDAVPPGTWHCPDCVRLPGEKRPRPHANGTALDPPHSVGAGAAPSPNVGASTAASALNDGGTSAAAASDATAVRKRPRAGVALASAAQEAESHRSALLPSASSDGSCDAVAGHRASRYGDGEDAAVPEPVACGAGAGADWTGRRVRKRFEGHGEFSGVVLYAFSAEEADGEATRAARAGSHTRLYRVGYSDGDSEDLADAEVRDILLPGTERVCPKAFLGRRIAKSFPPFGVFLGTIKGYERESGLLKAVYEDGDQEELSIDAVEEALAGGARGHERQAKYVGLRVRVGGVWEGDEGAAGADGAPGVVMSWESESKAWVVKLDDEPGTVPLVVRSEEDLRRMLVPGELVE